MTEPQSLRAAPSCRLNSHDPLQQRPFLRRRGQEQDRIQFDQQAEEDLRNFIKVMKLHEIFEAKDFFENAYMTQVQTNLVALVGLTKTKGFHTTIDIGINYAEKQTRHFDEGKLKAGQSAIGLQMGTKKCDSQAGMTAYGTQRYLCGSQDADRHTL